MHKFIIEFSAERQKATHKVMLMLMLHIVVVT